MIRYKIITIKNRYSYYQLGKCIGSKSKRTNKRTKKVISLNKGSILVKMLGNKILCTTIFWK